TKDLRAREAGDRPSGGCDLRCAVAHFMGSPFQFISDPGAYAPGFMLPPAPQAISVKHSISCPFVRRGIRYALVTHVAAHFVERVPLVRCHPGSQFGAKSSQVARAVFENG